MIIDVSKQLVNPPGFKPGSHSQKGDADRNESQRMEVQKKCAEVSRHADYLEKILPRLHHLDEKSVVAPEMENDYAMKEETEKELARGIEELNEHLPILEKEVQRCRENLQRIEGDSAKLNRREPMRSYLEAQAETKQQLFAAVGARDATVAVLARAQAVLHISQKKKFPGRNPQRQSPSPDAKPRDTPKSSQAKGTPSPSEKRDQETADLIALGPLGGNRK